jgi:hypothetical protein
VIYCWKTPLNVIYFHEEKVIVPHLSKTFPSNKIQCDGIKFIGEK